MTGHGNRDTSHYKYTWGILYLQRRESLQHEALIDIRGTAVSRKHAPLSQDWLTDRSRSEGSLLPSISLKLIATEICRARVARCSGGMMQIVNRRQ